VFLTFHCSTFVTYYVYNKTGVYFIQLLNRHNAWESCISHNRINPHKTTKLQLKVIFYEIDDLFVINIYLSSSTCEIIAKVKIVLLCNLQYLSFSYNAVVRQVIASWPECKWMHCVVHELVFVFRLKVDQWEGVEWCLYFIAWNGVVHLTPNNADSWQDVPFLLRLATLNYIELVNGVAFYLCVKNDSELNNLLQRQLHRYSKILENQVTINAV
jgi:hypothetical protein